jgi:hypothetical protein
MAIPAAREPGAFGDLASVAYRREGAFDGVSRSQVHPMIGREVVEGQQLISVVGDLGGRLGESGAVGVLERLDRIQGVAFVFGVPDLGERLLRPE